jgi:hypothetical protein
MASKKNESLRGESLKKLLLDRADNKAEEFANSINKLSEDLHMDLHAVSYGFEDISEMDSLVIRADILIERSLRQLAAAIAENPIPEHMNAAAIKVFIRLMEPLNQPYIAAINELNSARNIIAHQIDGDYTAHVKNLIRIVAPGFGLEINEFGLKAAVIITISAISNRRSDIKYKKGRSDFVG